MHGRAFLRRLPLWLTSAFGAASAHEQRAKAPLSGDRPQAAAEQREDRVRTVAQPLPRTAARASYASISRRLQVRMPAAHPRRRRHQLTHLLVAVAMPCATFPAAIAASSREREHQAVVGHSHAFAPVHLGLGKVSESSDLRVTGLFHVT